MPCSPGARTVVTEKLLSSQIDIGICQKIMPGRFVNEGSVFGLSLFCNSHRVRILVHVEHSGYTGAYDRCTDQWLLVFDLCVTGR